MLNVVVLSIIVPEIEIDRKRERQRCFCASEASNLRPTSQVSNNAANNKCDE